jgi:uncharacterized protein (DUF2147 family)
MKNLVILFLLITSFAKAQKLKGDEIIGTWLVGNSKAKIQITKTGDKFNGKIVWLKEPLMMQTENQNSTRKIQIKQNAANPIMGMALLNGFVHLIKKMSGMAAPSMTQKAAKRTAAK